MGTVNNANVSKPGGARALAAEHRKHQVAGAAGGLWGLLTLDGRKLFTKKKDKSGVAAPSR
jgi:hypothetical protein